MSGITVLTQLLSKMSPHLQDGEYAFCTTQGNVADYMHLNPVCFFQESEGLTQILLADVAKREYIPVSYTHLTLPTTPYV